MLRPTGPGKVRDIQVKGVDNTETTIKASLFNFDIDGDALKPQHIAWLQEHIVPQLGDASITINLTGEAGRSGSDAHNDVPAHGYGDTLPNPRPKLLKSSYAWGFRKVAPYSP
jgi:hypothetical protein